VSERASETDGRAVKGREGRRGRGEKGVERTWKISGLKGEAKGRRWVESHLVMDSGDSRVG
jgi:hypothetical protein